jgi:hypothetical protein
MHRRTTSVLAAAGLVAAATFGAAGAASAAYRTAASPITPPALDRIALG